MFIVPVKSRKIREVGTKSENAPAIVKKVHKKSVSPNPLQGLFPATVNGNSVVVEYEPDGDLQDTEQIPLGEEGGIDAFIQREVLPYDNDAWYDAKSIKIGYEISFNKYFYKSTPMRSQEEIQADILELTKESNILIKEIFDLNG